MINCDVGNLSKNPGHQERKYYMPAREYHTDNSVVAGESLGESS